jgi:small subunit ribosomal protein S2
MATIDKMNADGTYSNISKRERLQISRERDKLEKNLGSIADLTRLPAALFIVDIANEHIAVAEAKKLGIPTFAIVDTNSDPNQVDYAIPANDDASSSIALVIGVITKAIQEGLEERKLDKDKADVTDGKDDEFSDSKKYEVGEEEEGAGKRKKSTGGGGARRPASGSSRPAPGGKRPPIKA